MASRRKQRARKRTSILERFTQRRLKSLSATTGCHIYAIEKDTSIEKLQQQHSHSSSITIVNSERQLDEIAVRKIPENSLRLHLVEADPTKDPIPYLHGLVTFDATVLARDHTLQVSTIVQSLLYGLSTHAIALNDVRFSRWGSVRTQFDNLSLDCLQQRVFQFCKNFDLRKEICKRNTRFIKLLENHAATSKANLKIAADGCNVIVKVRTKIRDPNNLILSLVRLPVLAVGLQLAESTTDIMIVQKQRFDGQHPDGCQLFISYSPRQNPVASHWEETG